jgi:hypothetical protein
MTQLLSVSLRRHRLTIYIPLHLNAFSALSRSCYRCGIVLRLAMAKHVAVIVKPKATSPKKKSKLVTKLNVERMPIHSPDLHMLLDFGIPAIVVEVLLLLVLNPAVAMWGAIDGAELFAGVASVTAGLRKQGLVCVPYEIKLSETMDNRNPIVLHMMELCATLI